MSPMIWTRIPLPVVIGWQSHLMTLCCRVRMGGAALVWKVVSSVIIAIMPIICLPSHVHTDESWYNPCRLARVLPSPPGPSKVL